MQGVSIIFQAAILIMSVVVHEVAHGYSALMQGDTTARDQGRLTLNPLRHLDLFGSIILPGLLILTNSPFIIGWAKPVPFNPFNLRNKRWGEALVAGAGPLTNILLAVIFGLVIRFGIQYNVLSISFITIASSLVFINLVLALFNLVPIPPLDGSKLLFSVLPARAQLIRYSLERYGIFLVLFFVVFLWQYIIPVLVYIFMILTGVNPMALPA